MEPDKKIERLDELIQEYESKYVIPKFPEEILIYEKLKSLWVLRQYKLIYEKKCLIKQKS